MRRKRTRAMKESDFVFLEQIQNAVVILPDHRILAIEHFGQIATQAFDFDAMLAEMPASLLVMLGRLHQCLGGDAADIGEGAATRRLTLLVAPGVYSRPGPTNFRGANPVP